MTKKLKLITSVLLLATIAALACSCSSAPYNYSLSDYVTVGNYKGVEISASEIDTQLDASIQSFLSQNSTSVDVTDRPAKDGDTVNIDYEGLYNGEAFEGGTAASQNITIGSGRLIEGFEAGLIGANIGDKLSLNLKFPDEYPNSPDMAGKDVVFNVTVNSIQETTIPELTDELVHSNYSFMNTADEYKAEMRKSIKESLIWNKIVASSTISKYPEKEIKKYYDQLLNMYKYYASNLYGTTLEAYVQSTTGASIEMFLSELASQSKAQVYNDLVLYSIARAENITVTNDDYNSMADELALKAGYTDLKTYESAIGKDKVKESILWNKVYEFVSAASAEVE